MAHSTTKFKSNGDKASPSIKPFITEILLCRLFLWLFLLH
jgi:hypothetical protein